MVGAAEVVCLFQDRVEHRREVAGRAVDDAEHICGRGLLLQSLARLVDQPRVLHRDDGLRRKILQQRDLFSLEGLCLFSTSADHAQQIVAT